MIELLINPPFHALMGQDQSYVPLSLLWAANNAKDPGIYNFEIDENLLPLSFSERLNEFESYLSAVESADHPVWQRVRSVLKKYNPKEIWMTHYYAKELSINRVSDIAKDMNIRVRINRPYEEPFEKNKISGRRGRFERLLQNYNANSLAHIFTSSGCPYKCGFCLSDKKVQFREIEDIIYEMNYLVSNFSCDTFTFWDDAFTLSKKRIKKFAELKNKSQSSHVKYVCESRADSLNEEIVKILKDSGCVNVSVGFETGSPRLLKVIQKGETIKDYYKAADLLNKYSIQWGAYAMVGFPTETEEDVNLTFDLFEKTSPHKVTVSVYTPYPKTSLAKQFHSDFEEKQIIKMCHQASNINMTAMEDSVYEKVIVDFFRKFDEYNKER